MFGFLKNILGKGEDKTATPAPSAPAPAKPAAHAKPATPAAPAAAPAQPKPAPAAAHGPVENFTLPLKPILDKLPAALRDKVAQPSADGATVLLGIRSVAEQLQKGVVCVPFNELLKACPAGTFADAPATDATPVEIPLGVLMAKLDPKLLTRRTNQKKFEVPDDVTGLFGADVRAAAAGAKPAPAVAAPAPAPAPKPAESAPIKMSAPPPPSPAKAAAPPPPAPKPATPAPPPPSTPAAAPTTAEIMVKLSEVNGGWPAAVLQEIPTDADALVLPGGKVADAMRMGKIAFPWKLLRTCLRPAPLNNASPQDETVLELPLSVVAPVFMAANKPGGPQKKVAIDEKIPDMFSGKGPIAPPPPAPAPAAPVPAPAPGPTATSVSSPNEIIQSALKLPGVSGAVIALPEGLPVAAQLPPGLKAETVAAFAPQMFNRMSQSAKEMNLGDLDALTFTAGGVPWQIFKAGNLFFAVAGRKGESLPSAPLAAVAAELAKQFKK